MDDRVPPHNLQAEESLLGAMLLSKDAIFRSIDVVGPNDFYQPSHRAIFDAIVKLHASGEPVDPVSVAEMLHRAGELEWVGGQRALIALQVNTPATSSAGYYAKVIVDHALLRRLIHLGTSILESAYLLKDADEIIDVLKADLAGIDLPSAALPAGLMTVEDFMARDMDVEAPWIIPGLLRPLWRMIIVAEEGAGKTLLSQQLALAAARGIHPFTLEPMEPVTTLIIDGENPEERIYEGFEMIDAAMNVANPPSNKAWVWIEPGGIDLRKRAWRAQLEAVIQHVRPKLICLCPLYRMYEPGKDNDEIATREVQQALNDLRSRYRFALFIEHHAPKEQHGFRKLIGYGSVLWQRWPEIERALVRSDNNDDMENAVNFDLRKQGRAGDRVKNEWPRGLFKSTNSLPWAARWDAFIPPPSWRQVINDPTDNDDPF